MEDELIETGTEELQKPKRAFFPYCEAIATDIVTNPTRQAVREQILQLCTKEKLSSEDIATRINGQLPLRPGMSEKTAASIVRRICRQLIPEGTRKELKAVLHSRVMSANIDAVQKGKNDWMRAHNMFVWTDEYLEYFLELLQSDDFKRKQWRATTSRLKKTQSERQRPNHFNHDELANAMNLRFGVKDFNSERTRRKLERIREAEKANTNDSPSTNENNDEKKQKAVCTYLELLKENPLGMYISSIYFETITGESGFNIHELNRAVAMFALPLKNDDWLYVIDLIEKSMRTYSKSMHQFLHYIEAECHLQLGDTAEACKVLEYGVRSGGNLTEQINVKLKGLSRQEPVEVGRIAKSRRVGLLTLKWRKKGA